jgi:hypothetical protein
MRMPICGDGNLEADQTGPRERTDYEPWRIGPKYSCWIQPWMLSVAYQGLSDHVQATSPMIHLPKSGKQPFRGRPGPGHPANYIAYNSSLVITACTRSMPSRMS